MDDKNFKEFLRLLGKEKKEEEEARVLSGAELKEHFGKVFLASLKEVDNRRKKV